MPPPKNMLKSSSGVTSSVRICDAPLFLCVYSRLRQDSAVCVVYGGGVLSGAVCAGPVSYCDEQFCIWLVEQSKQWRLCDCAWRVRCQELAQPASAAAAAKAIVIVLLFLVAQRSKGLRYYCRGMTHEHCERLTG